ncbi:peptidase A2 domain-containing protein [Trichonephila clavipes]|nr:peptidase A2 domain-containing protein [Trichonephila clavipes]
MNNPENVQTESDPRNFQKFNMKDDISLNLTLFERHAELTFLPKKDWVQKLIGLTHRHCSFDCQRAKVDKCNDYKHVKGLVKKDLSYPRRNFVNSLFLTENLMNELGKNFSRNTNILRWMISGSNVETFDQLRELIIADQIKKMHRTSFVEHFLDEWSTINSPAEIAEKFERV